VVPGYLLFAKGFRIHQFQSLIDKIKKRLNPGKIGKGVNSITLKIRR